MAITKYGGAFGQGLLDGILKAQGYLQGEKKYADEMALKLKQLGISQQQVDIMMKQFAASVSQHSEKLGFEREKETHRTGEFETTENRLRDLMDMTREQNQAVLTSQADIERGRGQRALETERRTFMLSPNIEAMGPIERGEFGEELPSEPGEVSVLGQRFRQRATAESKLSPEQQVAAKSAEAAERLGMFSTAAKIRTQAGLPSTQGLRDIPFAERIPGLIPGREMMSQPAELAAKQLREMEQDFRDLNPKAEPDDEYEHLLRQEEIVDRALVGNPNDPDLLGMREYLRRRTVARYEDLGGRERGRGLSLRGKLPTPPWMLEPGETQPAPFTPQGSEGQIRNLQDALEELRRRKGAK